MKETTTAASTDSPKTVVSKLSFDAPLAKPPKLQRGASKPHRMNFLRRKAKSQEEDILTLQAKSQDEDGSEDDDEDAAEIKRLQRKVEYLEKKKKLVQTIKKIERGIETIDVESDDEASWEKHNSSPKRWRSFRLRRRRNRDRSDSFEDDLTFDDDDNSPLLQKFHSALDYIEDSCSPIIHEIKDLTVVCTELLSPSKDNDESRCAERVKGAKRSSKRVNAEPVPEQDAKSKTDEVPEGSTVPPLSPIITMITRQMSQSFSRTEDAADHLQEQKIPFSYDAQLHKNSSTTERDAVLETESARGREHDNFDSTRPCSNNEHTVGWMDKAAKILSESSQSLFLNEDSENVGLDCFKVLPAKPNAVPSIESNNEMDARFVKVTVTAMALSGLSISSRTNHQDIIPPVRAVLSVLQNTTPGEGFVFTHLPSVRVVKDPSRRPIKKNKLDRSAKYHVLGVWDISKHEDASTPGEGKSSVTFSSLIRIPTIEAVDKKTEVTLSPSTLHMRVCIKRDDRNDILPVGVAKVLISGCEPRDVELALPVRPEYYQSIADLTKKLDTKPRQSKWESLKSFAFEDEDDALSFVRFRGFKNETYHLEKDSFLRIRLKIAHDAQGHHSQLSPTFPLSKGTATMGASNEFSGTQGQTKCQNNKITTLSEDPRVIRTTPIISDEGKPFVNTSVRVEKNDGGGDISCNRESSEKRDSRDKASVDNPSINVDAYQHSKNKENTSCGLSYPLMQVDVNTAEKVVSRKSNKLWLKKTKMSKTKKAKASRESLPMLDTELDFENNPKGAAACVGAAVQESSELEHDQTHQVKHSCSNVVEAKPTLINMACPENTTNNVALLDSADKMALPQLESKCIDGVQANLATGLKVSEDTQPQAYDVNNKNRNNSDKSAAKKQGKVHALKSHKSWFKKSSLQSSKTEPPLSLCSVSFKESAASDPSLAFSLMSSDDGQALGSPETTSGTCSAHEESSTTHNDDSLQNVNQETSNLVMTSLKSKTLCLSHAISSNWTEDSLQVVKSEISLSNSTCDARNLTLPAAAEWPVPMNENSAGFQSNCDIDGRILDHVHTEKMKSDEPEYHCFCQVDEFMATDIARGANCIERDLLQLVNDYEFEVTPEEFLKAAASTKAPADIETGPVVRSNSTSSKRHECSGDMLVARAEINECNGSMKAPKDDHCDLSECHCEDCTNKSVASSRQEEAECEGIELELKKKHWKGVPRDTVELLSKQKETLSTRKLSSMTCLAGKLSRSKSMMCEI
ncbi:hypothetical protein ACHAWX_007593 [Stephanocyclus meneghinianus]